MNPVTSLKLGATAFTVLWIGWMLWWSGSFDRVNIIMLSICGVVAGYGWYRAMRWQFSAQRLAAAQPTSGRTDDEAVSSAAIRWIAKLPLALLLLVLAPFLFLVLAMAVVIIRIVGLAGFVLLQHRLARGRFAFRRFALVLAHSPVVLPGIEDEMQPGHHLFDRRQLAGWSGFAARTGFAPRAGLALRAGFAALALRTGLALRPGFAARTFRSGPAGMALRSGTSRFAGFAARALRPLFSFPDDFFVRHQPAPDVFEAHLADV
jgi:hypothetical protein